MQTENPFTGEKYFVKDMTDEEIFKMKYEAITVNADPENIRLLCEKIKSLQKTPYQLSFFQRDGNLVKVALLDQS